MEELNEYYKGQAEMDDVATAPKPAKKTPRKRK
jgi:hypothetical protein